MKANIFLELIKLNKNISHKSTDQEHARQIKRNACPDTSMKEYNTKEEDTILKVPERRINHLFKKMTIQQLLKTGKNRIDSSKRLKENIQLELWSPKNFLSRMKMKYIYLR